MHLWLMLNYGSLSAICSRYRTAAMGRKQTVMTDRNRPIPAFRIAQLAPTGLQDFRLNAL